MVLARVHRVEVLTVPGAVDGDLPCRQAQLLRRLDHRLAQAELGAAAEVVDEQPRPCLRKLGEGPHARARAHDFEQSLVRCAGERHLKHLCALPFGHVEFGPSFAHSEPAVCLS